MGKNIDKLPSGKYRARYSIPNGKRISKTFERQQEAKIWLNDQITRYEKHGFKCEAGKMYFSIFYENIFVPQYLKERGLKETSIADYNYYYYKKLYPKLEKVEIGDIDDIIIDELISEYSASVQHQIMSKLKVILDAAVKERMIQYNPARNKLIKRKTSKKKKKKIALEEEEIYSLSKELIKNETDNVADFAILLAITTGMRFGELAALEWDDVDYDNKFVNVNKNLQYNKITREPVIQTPKTEAGERKIPIGDDVIKILSNVTRNEAKSPEFKNLIFIRKSGLPLTDKACNERLEDVCKKVGITKVTMHDLRHTFATRCVESELDLPSVQKILGHSKLSMTLDVYTHISEKKKKNEMEKLNSIFD